MTDALIWIFTAPFYAAALVALVAAAGASVLFVLTWWVMLFTLVGVKVYECW